MRILKRKGGKYGARKVTNRHGDFDSAKEARRYQKLLLLMMAGEINNLQRQVVFRLVPGMKLEGEDRKRPDLRYVADFVYNTKDGVEVIEDAKGFKTPEYKIKKHLMAALLGKQIKEV